MYNAPEDQVPLQHQSAPGGPKGRIRVVFAITVVVTLAVGFVAGHYISPARVTTVSPVVQGQTATALPVKATIPNTAQPSSAAAGQPGTTSASNQHGYSTSDPFPLCDTHGASWTLTGIESEASGACATGNTPITVTQDGTYGFVSANGLPGQTTISPTNTVTVTGTLTGLPDNHPRCLGVAEGDSQTVYFGYICNDGSWAVSKLASLDVQTTLGASLAQGTFPFGATQPYSIAISLRPGELILTISLASSTTSPLTRTVTIPAITPTTVGFGYGASDPTLPINPSDFYGTVSQFSYSADE